MILPDGTALSLRSAYTLVNREIEPDDNRMNRVPITCDLYRSGPDVELQSTCADECGK